MGHLLISCGMACPAVSMGVITCDETDIPSDVCWTTFGSITPAVPRPLPPPPLSRIWGWEVVKTERNVPLVCLSVF